MRLHQIQNRNLDFKFHLFNSDNIQTLLSLKYFLKKTSKVRGDVVEFGIGRGRSLIILSYLLSQLKIKKKIFAFDSFRGFGKIHKKDRSWRRPKAGHWSKSPNNKYKYNLNFIKQILKTHLHPKSRHPIKFVSGFVEKSLPNFKKFKKISFIHCDVDLYLSHKIILETMWNKLSKNGIILFDDIETGIKSKKFPGAVIAFKEFFKNKKVKIYSDNNRKNIYIIK